LSRHVELGDHGFAPDLARIVKVKGSLYQAAISLVSRDIFDRCRVIETTFRARGAGERRGQRALAAIAI
jgi:hypothetical protein